MNIKNLIKNMFNIPINLLLIFLLILFGNVPANAQTTSPTTFTAPSCNETDVQNTIIQAINHATDGDIISIPAGNCIWATPLYATFSNTITIQGAGAKIPGATPNSNGTDPGVGTDQTIIQDNINRNSLGDVPLMGISTTAGKSFRMTGIAIYQDPSNTSVTYNGTITLWGSSKSVRIDHCHFYDLNVVYINVQGWMYGVMDHNLFDAVPGVVTNDIKVGQPGWNNSGSVDYGNASWADSPYLGSGKFIYEENNTYNYGFATDCGNGGRFVFRHNNLAYHSQMQTHGTTSQANVWRGCRSTEVYDNTMTWSPKPATDNDWSVIMFESGTGLFWGNTITGYLTFVSADTPRSNLTYSVQSSTPNPNGWGYCGNFTGNTFGLSNWDGNQGNPSTTNGYPCLDQIGRGKGDLLQGKDNATGFPVVDTVTGGINWPNQALEPVYVWGNALNSIYQETVRLWNNNGPTQENKDYFLQPGPNDAAGDYTNAPTPNFDGTAGVGQGLASGMPQTCTPNVGYWATDTNTLYQCSATNTWQPYYTPYTYPYPLDSNGFAISSECTTEFCAPTGLTATSNSPTQITLNWTASVDNNPNSSVVGYDIYLNNNPTPVGSTTTTSYSASNLNPATTYVYKIVAFDNKGNTSVPATIFATTEIPAPAAPSVVATADVGQVDLSWDAVPTATSYSVAYGSSSGNYGAPVSVGNTTSHSVTGLTNGQLYYFVVTASNASGTSPNSSEVSARPSATADSVTLTVILTKGYGSASVADSSGNSVSQSSPSTTDPSGDEILTYLLNSKLYYTVAATPSAGINNVGTTMNLNYSSTPQLFSINTWPWIQIPMPTTNQTLVISTTSKLLSPTAPTLQAPIAGNGQVNLSWNSVTGATGYIISYGTKSGDYTTSLSPTASNNALVTGLIDGQIYYFTVKAGNVNGASPNSNEVSATPQEAGLSITVNAGTGGSISCNGASCPASVTAGTSETFTETPAAGYTFSSWGGACSGSTATCTVVVNANTTVTASFAPITYVLIVSAGANGDISPKGTITVNYDANQIFTVTPATGYTASLTDNGYPVTLNNNTYTLSNVTAAHLIAASFTPITYTLTVTQGVNGTISPATSTVNAGASQTFTVTAASGYSVNQVLVDGAAVTLTNGTYTLNNVTANHSITASFVLSGSVLSIAVPSGSGTIQVVDANGITLSPLVANANPLQYMVSSNDTYEIEITPGSGQEISSVTMSNSISRAVQQVKLSYTYGQYGQFQLNMPATNYSVNVNLVPIPKIMTITASANANGSISPSGVVSVTSGLNQSFTITPNAGYTAMISVDGAAAVSAMSYTFSNVTANHTITASFVLQAYTITASAGANGSISSSQTINYGSNATFTITPNAGYSAMVSVDGAAAVPAASYAFSNVTANHTIAASFVLQIYAITASAGTNGSISGSQTVNYGSNATFTVTPNAGYSAMVSIDGAAAVTLPSNSYTFSKVQANHSITASFVQSVVLSVDLAAGSGSIQVTDASGTRLSPVTAHGNPVQYILNSNDYYEIAALPASGYQVGAVTLDGVKVSTDGWGQVHMSTPAAGAHSYTVSFTKGKPVVSILSPTVGTYKVGQTMNFQAQADEYFTTGSTDRDGNAIAQVQFLIDGIPVGTLKSANNSSPWDRYNMTWINLFPGIHTLTAVATNVTGVTSTSNSVNITVTD